MRSLLLALLLVGCGTGATGADGGCAERLGKYRITTTLKTGTCGPIADESANYKEQPAHPTPGCAGFVKYDATNCAQTGDEECPLPGGAATKSVSAVEWSADGDAGAGTLTYSETQADGGTACEGTYDVAYTKG